MDRELFAVAFADEFDKMACCWGAETTKVAVKSAAMGGHHTFRRHGAK